MTSTPPANTQPSGETRATAISSAAGLKPAAARSTNSPARSCPNSPTDISAPVLEYATGSRSPIGWLLFRHERRPATVESPRAIVTVEEVVVPTDELDRPAGVLQEQEDHVADGLGLVVAPLGDDGVDDEVPLGLPRLPPRVGLAKRVM